jgi:hypothetical protein
MHYGNNKRYSVLLKKESALSAVEVQGISIPVSLTLCSGKGCPGLIYLICLLRDGSWRKVILKGYWRSHF